MLAERDLKIDVMKEVATKNGERVRTPPAGRVRSDERALMSVARSTLRYESRVIAKDAPVKKSIGPKKAGRSMVVPQAQQCCESFPVPLAYSARFHT